MNVNQLRYSKGYVWLQDISSSFKEIYGVICFCNKLMQEEQHCGPDSDYDIMAPQAINIAG